MRRRGSTGFQVSHRLNGGCNGAEEDEKREDGKKCGHDGLVCIGAGGTCVDGREGDLRGVSVARMEPAGMGGVWWVRLDEVEGGGASIIEDGDAIAEGSCGLVGGCGEVGDGELGAPAIVGRG